MSEHERTSELVAAYLDGIMSDEKLAELDALVVGSDEHADAFARAASLDGMLELLSQDQQQLSASDKLLAQLGWTEVVEKPSVEEHAYHIDTQSSRSPRYQLERRHWSMSVAVSVTFLIATIATMHYTSISRIAAERDHRHDSETATKPAHVESIARLVDTIDAVWKVESVQNVAEFHRQIEDLPLVFLREVLKP